MTDERKSFGPRHDRVVGRLGRLALAIGKWTEGKCKDYDGAGERVQIYQDEFVLLDAERRQIERARAQAEGAE